MYFELRCRSAFSFLTGASLPEDLVARAAALDYPVIACGDRDGLYGAPRLHKAAQRAGLRAIVGCALRVAEGPVPSSRFPVPELYLLVASRAGYRNLSRLITQSKLRAAKGGALATWDDLEGRSDGLICLAGGMEGPLARAAAAGGDDLHRVVDRLRGLFPGRLYFDVQRHLEAEEERWNGVVVALAEKYGVPLVATNDVRHATAAERPLLDVLTCLYEKTTLDAAGRRLLRNAERHLKSPRHMAALFRDLPRVVANTRRIAEQCEFTLENLGYRFPDYPVPDGGSQIEYLRHLTYEGARRRYGEVTARVRRQLEHELALIGELELAGYFLIVWDIVRFCREANILAQGRGSAANSAVCYSLGITAVDAVGMELLFERFLSRERGEWPDIDIDLPSGDQRERVIQYVYQRYGERGAAMTANVITYRTRSAVREVGKVLGFHEEQIGRLAKLLNRFEFRDDRDQLAEQLREGGVDAAAPRVRQLVALVGRIQGLPRHLGQHSGGMVIAAGRLDEVVPLEPAAMAGRVVVQWDKDDCADLGIIKVDLLGLGMMAVLEDAIPLIREHEGVEVDLAHLPQDDPLVYDMLQRADTIGVFQVESRAQMATLPRLKPRCFYDLVVEVAIIRPGPIVGQMVHPYLDRRAGRQPVTYDHPSLEPILNRTLGVPLFQEQLLRMAMAVAGFTAGEAEELRRAMGFKRSAARMREIEVRLRDGMAKNGITGDTAERIVRSITSFALYGFPESHAASFALIAYASAYLRAHHMAAFLCAMLNNWPMGFYHPATLVKDAQRHGLHARPIDVTRSQWQCTVENREPGTGKREPATANKGSGGGGKEVPGSRFPVPEEGKEVPGSRFPVPDLAVRLGLRYVAGLRREAGERIAAARRESAFVSIADVAARADLRDDELQALAHVGAFAAFDVTRREALWQAAAVPRRGTLWAARSREPGTGNREHQEEVVHQPLAPRPTPRAPAARSAARSPLPEMSKMERTLADYRASGVTVGPHLMRYLRDELAREGVARARDLAAMRDGHWVKVAGLVIVRQRPGTAKGFCFLTLEDETGVCNAVVVPAQFARHRALIHRASLLLVEGPLQIVEGVIHVRARRFRELALPRQAIHQRGHGYRMRVTPEEGEGAEEPHRQPPPHLPKSHDFH
jgi:error-prone DNA polymerase